jgi:thiamine pyrophosphate-dependent acetolactate synthase large subunit-like protein
MLKPQRVLECLRDAVSDLDAVIWTTGVGQHQMRAMQYLVWTGREASSPRAVTR